MVIEMSGGGAVHRRKGEPVSNVIDTFAYASLTLREKDLLLHVLEGHPNKVIAQHLGVTEAAAKFQLKRLLRKINVDNRTQATIWALRNLPNVDAAVANFSRRRAVAHAAA
jgi:DNA-binding CsgD family transcriptional regulator